MNKHLWKPRQSLTAYFFFVSAAGLLLTISLNILLNGTSESAVFLGLSTERLLLVGGSLLVGTILTFLGVRILQEKSLPFPSSHWAIYLTIATALLIFSITWFITWTPAEKFGTFYYYLGRLYPFIVWLTCFSGIGLALLLVNHLGLDIQQFQEFIKNQRATWVVAAIALLAFGLATIGIALRVVHMQWYEEDFWYGAGVPVLALQVVLAVATTVALTLFTRKFSRANGMEKKPWVDWAIFIVIWIVAAWLWVREPVNPDFFITKPVAPNYELYPDYDAKFFDLFSQYALIGQGLNNRIFYDRPLYSALLVYLHTFVGQDYLQVIAWQTALFAIFPALAYLLGKQLHSRAVGIGIAFLLALRGVSSIMLGPFINTAHQKQMMTDFPSAILMLLMTVLLIDWLKEPAKRWTSLVWAAGVLGFATLLRPHPLIYIPILIALAIWVYRSQKRLWLTFSALICVAAMAGVMPWVVSSGHGKSLVDLYLQKIRNVIETRYPNLHLPGSSELSSPMQVAAIDDRYLFHPANPQAPTPPDKSILAFGTDHFLNNLMTTLQVLPYSPYYQEPRDIVKNSENFWRPYWDGTLSPWAKVMLFVNLALLALGLGAACKRLRWNGLVPLMVMLAYYIMNALARTSGGRYIVPVDWVVILYYFLGIVALIEIIGAFFSYPQPSALGVPQPQATIPFNRATWLRMGGVLATFVVIGSLIPLSANLYQRRFPSLTRADLARQVIQKSGSQLGVSNKEWQAFLASPQATIVQGRILYPRQFEKDDGFKVSIYKFYYPKPYPRMLFTMIGPSGETPAILASMQAPPIPNTSDAIILGCRESTNVQVCAILLNGGEQIFKRTPSTAAESLICPLQEPVCDNNHHCK